MLRGQTLQDLAKTLEDQQTIKDDFIVNTRMVEMNIGSEGVNLQVPGKGTFNMNHICHNQVADKLGIPIKYYDRMMDEEPSLLVENVNRWMHKDPVRRMFRTLGTTARAFLSDRYLPLDNIDLAEAVVPTLVEQQAVIRSAQLTDSRMYIQASLPSLQGEVKKGDVVQSGIIVSNSEVGMGSLRVEPFFFRLVCKNGMIAQESIRKHHLGQSLGTGEGTWNLLTDKTRQLTNEAFFGQLKDVVAGSFSPEYFNTILNKFRETTGEEIEGDLEKVIDITTSRFGLGKDERNSVLKNLINGGDLSRWGLANAVTRVGHTTESYDRCVDLERFGGKIITEDAVWRDLTN